MLQAANTDLLNPLVPKAHNSACQNITNFFYFLFSLNLPFSLQVKPVNVG